MLRPRGIWFGGLAWARIYRRLELVELTLGALPPLAPADGLDIRWLGDEELDALTGLGGPWSPGEASARFDRGHRCFAALEDGDVVSARWVVSDRAYVSYVDSWLELDPGESYLYESYTHPSRRGRGISPALGTRLARALAAEGCTRIVSAALPERREATRAWQKVGYRRIGRIGYLGLGPWRRRFTSS
jgi:GNAT superfamily N-acetyltransferase